MTRHSVAPARTGEAGNAMVVALLVLMLLTSAAQTAGRFMIKDVSPIDAVRSIDTPILLAHGYSDDIIPVSESKRLFEAARGPVALHLVEGKHVYIRQALGSARRGS